MNEGIVWIQHMEPTPHNAGGMILMLQEKEREIEGRDNKLKSKRREAGTVEEPKVADCCSNGEKTYCAVAF